jgi:hypothetical protein
VRDRCRSKKRGDGGDSDEQQYHAKHRGHLAQAAANELRHPPHPFAHADILDRDRHLGQQVEEVEERDPDDEDAEGKRRGEDPAEDGSEHARGAGEGISAHEKAQEQDDGCGGRVDDQQATSQLEVPRRQPSASREEWFDVGDVRATQRRQSERRAFDRSGVCFGFREDRDRAAFDDESQRGGAEQHHQERGAKGDERDRVRPQRARHTCRDLPEIARHHLFRVCSQQEYHEEDASDHRHSQQQFQRAFGDELDRNQRPVRGRNEGAAFQ